MSIPKGFPILTPALIVKLDVTGANFFGQTSSGSTLSHFETPKGTIETVEGFEPAFKGDIVFGADWITSDPDGGYGHLDLKLVAKTKEGSSIDIAMQGHVELTDGLKKIFTFNPEMKTVPFGSALGQWQFMATDPKLKALTTGVFASNGRIAVHEDGSAHVESRVAKVSGEAVMD